MPMMPFLIVLTCILGGLAIPVLAIMSAHQQKMAKLFNEKAPVQPELLDEIRALREVMNEQAIQLDNLSARLDRMTAPSADRMMVERISESHSV